jgi:hypothetical protein
MRASRWLGAIGGTAVVVTAVTLGSALASSGVAGARSRSTTSTPAPTTADYDLELSVQANGTTYDGSAVGQVDFAGGQVAATINVPEGFGAVISAIDPGIASKVPAAVDSDTSAQAVYSAGTLYLSMAGLPIGSKQWVGVPFQPSSAMVSAFETAAKGLENVKTLGKLARRLGSSITSLGTQTIDGATANGYSTSIATASLLSLLHGISSTTSAEVLSILGPSLPVEVWAEPSGPVVQLTIDLSPPSGSVVQSLNLSLALSNWGAPLTITVPPASEVFSISSALDHFAHGYRETRGAEHTASPGSVG